MKIFGVFCIYFSFCVPLLFSQNWFVGGNINIGIYGINKQIDDYKGNSTNINVSPIIGYKINELDFGLNPIFQYGRSKHEDTNGSSITDFFGFGIGIFSRYNLITFGKFSILGQLGIDYVITIDNNDWTGSYKINRQEYIIMVSPIFEYKLLDNLSLYTILGGRASYSYNWYRNGNYKTNLHSFNFSFLQIFKLSDISIGFYILL